MAIRNTDSIILRCERYGSGEPMTDAEIDDIRKNVEPSTWLNLCRAREAAITAMPPKQLGPMPEGTQVRLKSGGPVMTVEDTRDSVKLVQCLWFDDARHVQRDAFHKDALETVSAVPGIGLGLWGEITDSAIDQVACEIYRANCEASDQRFHMPAWMNIGEEARASYRLTARAAWKAFLELQP